MNCVYGLKEGYKLVGHLVHPHTNTHECTHTHRQTHTHTHAHTHTHTHIHTHARTLVMDFMILFLDSVCVGQFPKKNRSESFLLSFSPVSGCGESWNARFSDESVRLSSSLVLKGRANDHLSTNTMTTQVLSAEERFMSGCCCPAGPSSPHS